MTFFMPTRRMTWSTCESRPASECQRQLFVSFSTYSFNTLFDVAPRATVPGLLGAGYMTVNNTDLVPARMELTFYRGADIPKDWVLC